MIRYNSGLPGTTDYMGVSLTFWDWGHLRRASPPDLASCPRSITPSTPGAESSSPIPPTHPAGGETEAWTRQCRGFISQFQVEPGLEPQTPGLHLRQRLISSSYPGTDIFLGVMLSHPWRQEWSELMRRDRAVATESLAGSTQQGGLDHGGNWESQMG